MQFATIHFIINICILIYRLRNIQFQAFKNTILHSIFKKKNSIILIFTRKKIDEKKARSKTDIICYELNILYYMNAK